MDELLRVESLCAGYGQRRVLRDVSFSVRRGELCALLGANGSGKSTLLRALCGLTDAPEGCMLLEAESLRDMSCRRRAQRIGYLAQRSACELALSVMDVVLMGCNPALGPFQKPGPEDRRRAMALLAELGDAAWAEAGYLSLSEGQRQLVLFARTLVRRSPLLLLDEPDSALEGRGGGFAQQPRREHRPALRRPPAPAQGRKARGSGSYGARHRREP